MQRSEERHGLSLDTSVPNDEPVVKLLRALDHRSLQRRRIWPGDPLRFPCPQLIERRLDHAIDDRKRPEYPVTQFLVPVEITQIRPPSARATPAHDLYTESSPLFSHGQIGHFLCAIEDPGTNSG
jgi:hypothetical protein